MQLARDSVLWIAGDSSLSNRDGFAALLEVWLNVGAGGRAYKVRAAPFPGEPLSGYRARLDSDVFSGNPDALVLMPGNADLFYSREPNAAEIRAAAEEAIEHAARVLGAGRLLVTSLLPASEDRASAANSAAACISSGIEKSCRNRGIEYLNVFEFLLDCAVIVVPRKLTAGGRSLTPIGEFLLFRALSGALEPTGRPAPRQVA